MKQLPEYIKDNKFRLISLSERLTIDKNYKHIDKSFKVNDNVYEIQMSNYRKDKRHLITMRTNTIAKIDEIDNDFIKLKSEFEYHPFDVHLIDDNIGYSIMDVDTDLRVYVLFVSNDYKNELKEIADYLLNGYNKDKTVKAKYIFEKLYIKCPFDKNEINDSMEFECVYKSSLDEVKNELQK